MGLYLGVKDGWLRYFAPDGSLVLGPEETARREQEQAKKERQRAEQAELCVQQERAQVIQERQRAERLAQRLRDLGVAPDDQDFRYTRKFVIPAKAGIHSFQRMTGFPHTRE